MTATPETALTIRSLSREDFDDVVTIDAAIEGRSRRGYIERRLAAALRDPSLHAQFAAVDARGLAGYVLARVLSGEFGIAEPAMRLELVGMRADAQGKGVGTRLLQVLSAWAQRRGLSELRTAATWNNHAMLRWLDATGFRLAPESIVDCAVDGGAYKAERDDSPAEANAPAPEIDYGAAQHNDFERLARDSAGVRSMTREDLKEISRIDRHITGRDREAYIRTMLDEALDTHGVRVSLASVVDGVVVGYLMARADLGDFGRVEPTAVIDTIGVDPDYMHRGVGHALLSQLFVNLGALRIERVESLVGPGDLALLGFLYSAGFAPSQRLAFVRKLN